MTESWSWTLTGSGVAMQLVIWILVAVALFALLHPTVPTITPVSITQLQTPKALIDVPLSYTPREIARRVGIVAAGSSKVKLREEKTRMGVGRAIQCSMGFLIRLRPKSVLA